jgi:hypothetical protein
LKKEINVYKKEDYNNNINEENNINEQYEK